MPSLPQQTLAAAVVVIAEEKEGRTTILVQNNSAGGQTLRIDDSAQVAATQGIHIAAGGHFLLEKALGYPTEKRWHGIGSAAGTLVDIWEGFGEIPSVTPIPGEEPILPPPPSTRPPGTIAPPPGIAPEQPDQDAPLPSPPGVDP